MESSKLRTCRQESAKGSAKMLDDIRQRVTAIYIENPQVGVQERRERFAKEFTEIYEGKEGTEIIHKYHAHWNELDTRYPNNRDVNNARFQGWKKSTREGDEKYVIRMVLYEERGMSQAKAVIN